MKFNIILPFYNPTSPIGGVKIMYEIANFLSVHQDVTVYHSLKTPYLNYPKTRPFLVRKLIAKIRDKNVARPSWFQLNDNVKSVFINQVNAKTIKDADATLYTWYSLGFPVSRLPHTKGRKFYFVQGYEIWEGNEDKVHQSYNLPGIHYLCISEFLFGKVKSYNANSGCVHQFNLAIDEKKFFVSLPLEKRNPLSICMLYSDEDHVKGSNIGIAAIEKLKQEFPELSVTFFSVYQRNSRIPNYINFENKPKNLPELYNSHAIFVSPSYTEGWALPPAEAMMCGCALICTDIPGHQSYALASNSLKFQPGDVNGLVKALRKLLSNNELRIDLAEQGVRHMQHFTWNETMRNFYQILNEE